MRTASAARATNSWCAEHRCCEPGGFSGQEAEEREEIEQIAEEAEEEEAKAIPAANSDGRSFHFRKRQACLHYHMQMTTCSHPSTSTVPPTQSLSNLRHCTATTTTITTDDMVQQQQQDDGNDRYVSQARDIMLELQIDVYISTKRIRTTENTATNTPSPKDSKGTSPHTPLPLRGTSTAMAGWRTHGGDSGQETGATMRPDLTDVLLSSEKLQAARQAV